MLTRTGSVTTGHRLSRTPAGLTQPAAVHRGGRASPQRSSYYSQDRIVYHHWPAGRPLRPPSAAPAGGQDPVRLVAGRRPRPCHGEQSRRRSSSLPQVISAQPREVCGGGSEPAPFGGRRWGCHSFGWCLVSRVTHLAGGKIV